MSMDRFRVIEGQRSKVTTPARSPFDRQMTVGEINRKYLPGFCAKHALSWHDDVWPAMVNGVQAPFHREGSMCGGTAMCATPCAGRPK